MFEMRFKTDNAAFDDRAASETGRILRSVARRIEAGELDGVVTDVNGNTIGTYCLDGNKED